MKYRRILALLTIILLSVSTAVVATTSTTAISFKNQSSTSTQELSNKVFVDPYLQEASSAKSMGASERLIVIFNPTVNGGLRTRLLSSIEGVKIIQEYKVISGATISAPLSAIESIKKLDGVKAIWLDHKVEALNNSNKVSLRNQASPTLSHSTGLINAPSLWALGVNGSGKVIAVVDTGINWHHESLNDLDDNPATNDPKVIANVSFVTGVSTGLDDHGHGTHVAGIAAGTGGSSHIYRGVAPGAQLCAVKVIDMYGWGYWSWVIAGIDWSIEQKVDIITMSIGGWGHPYDPVCMASDAAVDTGIIVTVAAGNEYGYWTVNSPGLAKKVITVGASTMDDTIAAFSSGGPNNFDSRGDPDVVAPGVEIMSADAWNITGYVPMSGTSMSTPHVAGGSALLLQAFAGATPELVGSALMASATDLGFDSYLQGAGRIDVLEAYNLITKSMELGTLSLKTASQKVLQKALPAEVSPHSAWFTNARIQFEVDSFGDIFYLQFDGRDQWAVMAWRIAYNTSNFASWFDLEVIQPVSMRMWNKTYQQAFGALRTPDKAVAIFVMVELFGNETWARTSFMVWPMDVTLENLRIFYIEDVGMNEGYQNDWSYYYSSQDTFIVNDTLESPPAQHFGFGGGLNSSAHHVGEWPSAWYAAYYDELNNETEWIGDDNNAFRWSLGTTTTPTTVPVIFGLGYNVSAVFSMINEGRATPPTPFNIIPYPELSVSVSGPTMTTPDLPTIYTATVANQWIGNSVGATLTLYLDGTPVNSSTINVPSGALIKVPVNVSMSKGFHRVKAEVIDISDPLPQNNFAMKKVFVGIMFSALLPCEFEVNTYTGFGPFSQSPYAWVNLTIITPTLMPDVEIRLTGDLSQVISFVDPPTVGDIEGWSYFAFEVYASGAPNRVYSGFIQIISADAVMNELPVTVNVGWNPTPKINSVSLNDTSVLRVTETLGVTINVTDIDSLGNLMDPLLLTVSVYLLYYDIELFGWGVTEVLPVHYNAATGLFEFNYTFPASWPIDQFYGIDVEAIDPDWYGVLAMTRPFYVANNVPVVSTTLFPHNIAGNETVSINVTTSDVETTVKYLKLNGFVKTPTGREIPIRLTLVDGVFTTTFNDTSEEGTYIFVISVTDSDGISIISTALFEVDNAAPKVDIISPMDGALVSGTVNITFVAEDPRLENASLVIDNDPPINVTGTNLFTLNTTTLTDGTHTIRLVAFDTVGNNAEVSLLIIVDNTVPRVNIKSPEEGVWLAGTTTIEFTALDINLDKVLLYLDATIIDVTGETSYDWNTTEVDDGTHVIIIAATDGVRNTNFTSITVIVDNTEPALNIISPENGTNVAGPITIRFLAFDTNLLKIVYSINGGASIETVDETSFIVNTTTMTDGSFNLSITAIDRAENSAMETLTLIADNSAPAVAITSPKEGIELTGTITIEFNASDINLDKVLLYIDNAEFNVIGTASYGWDTTAVGDGNHTIRLVATDKAGNSAETSVTVNVVNVKHAIEKARNLYLALGASMVAVSILVAYAIAKKWPRKNRRALSLGNVAAASLYFSNFFQHPFRFCVP